MSGSRLLLGSALLSLCAFAGAHVDPGDRLTGISTDDYSGFKQDSKRRALFGDFVKAHGNPTWTAPAGVSYIARIREAMSKERPSQLGSTVGNASNRGARESTVSAVDHDEERGARRRDNGHVSSANFNVVLAVARGGTSSSAKSPVAKADPKQAYLGAVVVLALGALGSWGLLKLYTSGALEWAWPVPFIEPWQVLTFVAYVMNFQATRVKGRLDGSGNRADSQESPPVRFFTPASWAFIIWAPVFLGEAVLALVQLSPSVRGSWWLYDLCPWFSAAMLFQTLWCLSFRSWAADAGLLWLPALMLALDGVALGGAHNVLREAWLGKAMTIPGYIVAHLPISLHFGWISCATLVNLNGYLSSLKAPNLVQLLGSVVSTLVAVVLGTTVTLVRESPVYSTVIAWALWAVGSKAGWRNLEGRVDKSLIMVQEVVAKVGSVLCLLVAGISLAMTLSDPK